MAKITRPEIGSSDIFANAAPAADITSPSQGEIDKGFIYGQKPKHQGHNFLWNLWSKSLGHLFQNGIAEWSTTTEYTEGALAKEGAAIYQAVVDNTGKQPTTNMGAFWKSFGGVPVGTVVSFTGLEADIPSDWSLCDGTNGTVDLRNRFIMGASDDATNGNTGGSADAVAVSHTHTANHDHTGSTNSTGGHSHTANHSHTGTSASAGSHTHDIWVDHDAATSHGGTQTIGKTVSPEQLSGYIVAGGAHTHTITIATKNFSTSSQADHSHTVTIATKNFSTASSGVSGTDKNLPPYRKVFYIQKMI